MLVILALLLLSGAFDMTSLSETDNVYLVIVVLQLLVFLLPTFIYCKLKGKGYAKRLRLLPPRADALFCPIIASVVLISGEILLGVGLKSFFDISEGFSLYGVYSAIGTSKASNLLYVIFAFALIPALCEEFLFRSVLICEYESCGVFTAVVASSILFSVIHFNPEKLPIYLFSGIILAITLYATRSVISSITVHFIYNIFGLFGQKYMSTFMDMTGSYELFVFLVALVFLIFLVLLFAEVGRLYAYHAEKNRDSSYVLPRKEKKGKLAEALLSPTYLVCLLLFVIVAVV